MDLIDPPVTEISLVSFSRHWSWNFESFYPAFKHESHGNFVTTWSLWWPHVVSTSADQTIKSGKYLFLLFCGVGSISLPQTPRIRRLHPSTSDIGSSFRIMMFHLVFNLHCHQKCEICRNLMVACSNHSQWNQLDTEGNFNFFTTVFLGDCDHDGLHRGCAHGPHCDCARDLLYLLDWAPGTGCTLREAVAEGFVPWIVDCSPLGQRRQRRREPRLLRWKVVSKRLLGSHCNPEFLLLHFGDAHSPAECITASHSPHGKCSGCDW